MAAGVRGQVGLIVVKQDTRLDIVPVIIPRQDVEARSVLETIRMSKSVSQEHSGCAHP